jgi:hypothetical protein
MEKDKVKIAKVELEAKASALDPDHLVFAPGELGAILDWTVTDKDGKIREHRTIKSKSYVRQFFDLLMVQMNSTSELVPATIRDTGNIERDICVSAFNFACNAVANTDSYGIQVGTGNTAPTISDYKLQTQIAHGSGAGQLQYGGVAFGLPASDAIQSHFTITRDFSNLSGTPITVYEIGLVVKGDIPEPWQASKASIAAQYNFLTIRDVIAAGINVLNGETLTVNYRQVANV